MIPEGEMQTAAEDGIEMMRSVRYSMLGIDSWKTGLFDPEESDWESWLAHTFRSVLMERMQTTLVATGEFRMEAVFAADRQLEEDSSLSVEAKKRSLLLGQLLCESQIGAKSLRQLDRFKKAEAENRTPGHGPIAFALKCGLYHLPALTTLLSYAYLEWKVAKTNRHEESSSRVEDFFAEPANCQLLIDAQQYVCRTCSLQS